MEFPRERLFVECSNTETERSCDNVTLRVTLAHSRRILASQEYEYNCTFIFNSTANAYYCGGEPVFNPTLSPTLVTTNPTRNPSVSPIKNTINPTQAPTITPTLIQINPTQVPTVTMIPTSNTYNPTIHTDEPISMPTLTPTTNPTLLPTSSPTKNTINPTQIPTETTNIPTVSPTVIQINPTSTPTDVQKLTNTTTGLFNTTNVSLTTVVNTSNPTNAQTKWIIMMITITISLLLILLITYYCLYRSKKLKSQAKPTQVINTTPRQLSNHVKINSTSHNGEMDNNDDMDDEGASAQIQNDHIISHEWQQNQYDIHNITQGNTDPKHLQTNVNSNVGEIPNNNIQSKNDNKIAQHLQQNQQDIHDLTKGHIPSNEFETPQ